MPPSSQQGTQTGAAAGQDASYTQMGPESDLESIGRHCQFEYCGQLDFLPFHCQSCKGTFCLDHRTETAHKCSRAGEWASARRDKQTISSKPPTKPTVYNSAQCSSPSCKTLIHTIQNTGVHCQNCNRDYCLKHRLREDHDCSNLVPLGARPSKAGATAKPADNVRLAFGRLRAWGKDKSSTVTSSITPKSKPNAASSRLANLNALKKSAKGDPNLDLSKRFYLHVEASADTTKAKFPTGDFYFDSSWSVGKMLDDAARKLQVENVNNRIEGEDQRLRVFHVEGGHLLEFSQKIGSSGLSQGDTVVLLRGVGPPVPDLIKP